MDSTWLDFVLTNAYFFLVSLITIIIGASKSLQPQADQCENIDRNSAIRFPFMASIVLLSMYLLIKFIPAYLIKLAISCITLIMYNVSLGCMLSPLQRYIRDQTYYVVLIFCLSLLLHYLQHWMLDNLIALSLAITAIQLLRINSTVNGMILISGLFVYDIFWVFCTPVMVAVATSINAPIKLVMPRNLLSCPPDEAFKFAMLGLGDIVLPGTFIAFLYRFDVKHGIRAFFPTGLVAYGLGLLMAMGMSALTKKAQPALLYLTPACIISSCLTAYWVDKLTYFLWYKDESEETDE